MSKYGLNIAFFGSSLLSTYRNSVATYFRGIIRHLHQRGHQVTFYEPDVSSRQQHRDLFKPDWVEVNVYRADEDGVYEALEEAQSAEQRFLLGGNDWEQKPRPDNVTYLNHVVAEDENAFNCSPLAILSVSQSRANRHGVAPPIGLFEAAGAGACVITNNWEGVELFLEPGPEILVAGDGDDVVDYLKNLTIVHAHKIGQAARHRILDQHTYAHRAAQLEAVLTGEKVLL